ncbi:MAG: TonB-dependent receptor [Alistipes sp.]|nr:TonB-dependent receptor [Alistipes sp.]
MKLRYLISIFFALVGLAAVAQTEPAVQGRVVDSASKQAIAFANVVITDDANATIATATVNDGFFSIERVRKGEFYLSVTLVGYQPYTSEKIAFGDKSIDLGTIALEEVETGLKEIVVTGEKNKIVYKLDRQRISGDASLSAAGGTAIDVLSSTPSIRIDADGGVSFRGSTGFLVYIDGKQSALEGTQALAQIPAANIEDIEIITTPSARYKTDGDVGIINIITKRSADEGFSGTMTASGSTIGAWNTDLTLSYKQGNSRFYIGGTAAEDRGKSDFDQTKTTIVDEFTTTSVANGTRQRNNSTYVGRLGWEFAKNDHSLAIEAQSGMMKTARGGDMLYDEDRRRNGEIIIDQIFNSHDRYSNEKQLAQISTDYVWKINERGDIFSLTSRIRYDWYALEYTESNMFELSGTRYEGTRGYESEHHWDIDAAANYTLNYSPKGKAEVGYQFTSYSEHGDYNIKYWDRPAHDFIWQDDLYTPFYYRRQIHSAYLMLNHSFGNLEVDAGVRADHTIDEMTIAIEGASRYIKRTELFPSAHLAYALNDNNTLTAGYSYRTNRPGIWQLEPYITYEDYYTKMTGNPDIAPEYIHSAEVGYRKRIAEKHSLALTAFYRDRTDVRERVRVAYEPGVTLDSLINAGDDRSWGVELSARIKATPKWDITLNGSLYDYKFTAKYEGCTDATNTGYAASMINNFTLGKSTRLQVDANVVGPTVLSQGREDAYYYFDVALRQQLFSNRLTASVVMHDILRTARYDNYRISPTLNSVTRVKPKYPNIVFSLSYAFNSKHKEHTGAVTQGTIFEGKDF